MSIWTHVNAAIRIDGIPGTSRRPTIGELPYGTEGQLLCHVREYYTGLPWLAYHIHGDLRDYDDIEAIKTYLFDFTAGHMVRSGVASIEVEHGRTVLLHNTGDGWREVAEEEESEHE